MHIKFKFVHILRRFFNNDTHLLLLGGKGSKVCFEVRTRGTLVVVPPFKKVVGYVVASVGGIICNLGQYFENKLFVNLKF